MEDKRDTFGNIWWHRVLVIAFYIAYVLFYFALCWLLAGLSWYVATESNSLNEIQTFLVFAAVSVPSVLVGHLILESTEFVFFYIFKNKRSGFWSNFFDSIKRKLALVAFVLVIFSVCLGSVIGFFSNKEYAQYEIERIEKEREGEKRDTEERAERYQEFLDGISSSREKGSVIEADAEPLTIEPEISNEEKNCRRTIGSDYNFFYGICGVNESCLRSRFDKKGYSGNEEEDIKRCVDLRSGDVSLDHTVAPSTPIVQTQTTSTSD